MKLGIGRLTFVTLACLALAGCPKPATDPSSVDRATARSRILLVSNGVAAADATCSAAAKMLDAAGKRDLGYTVASACAHGYAVARGSLLTAEAALAVYGEARAGQWACAAKDGLAGLREMEAALKLAGVPIPAAVVDGLSITSTLAGVACVVSEAAPPSHPAADAGEPLVSDASTFDVLPEGG